MKTKQIIKYCQAVSIVFLAIWSLFIEPSVNLFLQEAKALQLPAQKAYGLNTKWGFLVSVNLYQYMKSDNQLTGCVNDVKDFEDVLVNLYDFSPNNIGKLINSEATRDNILGYLRRMANTVKDGDLFTFYFSGHGTLFPDRNSLEQDEETIISPKCSKPPHCFEPDTYDSALCPTDTCSKTDNCSSTNKKPWKNLILDDELFEIFSQFTSKGCLVIFITDSCHSGTIGRGARGNYEPSFTSNTVSEQAKFLPLDVLLEKSWLQQPESEATKPPKPAIARDMKGLYLVISSSQDYQSSYETDFSGIKRGAFTSSLTSVIRHKGKTVSYQELFQTVEQGFALNKKNELGQQPSLSSKYCKESLLDRPLFSFPNDKELKVAVKVVDKEDEPLANSYFVILKPGIKPQANITKKDTIIIAKTDEKGIFNSNQKVMFPGKYWVKVVRKGFKPYVKEAEVKAGSRADTAVFKFELALDEDINSNKTRSNNYENENFNDEEFFELQLDEQEDNE